MNTMVQRQAKVKLRRKKLERRNWLWDAWHLEVLTVRVGVFGCFLWLEDMKGMPFLQLPVKTHNCCSRCSCASMVMQLMLMWIQHWLWSKSKWFGFETTRTHEIHWNPFPRYPKMFHCIPGAFLPEVEIHATGHHFCHWGSGFQPQFFYSCPLWTSPTPHI